MDADAGGNKEADFMTDEQPPCEPDPLIGEEIIRISLESSTVDIHLEKSQVQIGSSFLVRRVGHDNCRISPQSKAGEVSALWPSLGSRIVSVVWGRDLVLTLDDGNGIVVPPSSYGYRGLTTPLIFISRYLASVRADSLPDPGISWMIWRHAKSPI